jgi:tetratricopeptide (TPR) repeat protein
MALERASRESPRELVGRALEGDIEGAVTSLRAFLEESPDDETAWLSLGTVLSSAGRWGEAADALARAVELDPTVLAARLSYARALEKTGRLDDAAFQLLKAERLSPDDAHILKELGVVFYKKGLYDKSVQFLTRVRALVPADARVWYTLGLVQEARRDPGAAIAAYRESIKLDPAFGDPKKTLADLLASMGEHEEAVAVLDDLLRIERTNEQAAQNRDVLAKALEDMRARRLLGKTERELEQTALVHQGQLKRRGTVPRSDEDPANVASVVRYGNRVSELFASLSAAGAIVRLFLVLLDPEKAAKKRDDIFQVTVVGQSGRREPVNLATAMTVTFLREALGAPLTQASELYAKLLAERTALTVSGAKLGFSSAPRWDRPGETMHGLAVWLLAMCVAVLVSCRPAATPIASQGVVDPATTATATASAAATDAGSMHAPATPIAFIDDDYDRARSMARAAHRPLFIDAWATWCHTCLAMKEYVFVDPALAPVSSKVVWASIDTEKPASEGFLQKFPMQAWPTLWVIDPDSESPLLKWPGSATAKELATLLEDATEEFGEGSKGERASGSAEASAAWLRGNRQAAEGHPSEAAREYESALVHAPPQWAKRPRVVEALVTTLEGAHRAEPCFSIASREWKTMPPGTSRLNVELYGLECGTSLPKDERNREPMLALARDLERLANDATEPVLADDRSSVFDGLVTYYRSTGDADRTKSVARAWRDYLDREAARAPTPAARAVFDTHRVLAYEANGEPEKAVTMLAESERDFPGDYNPPARLAGVYLRMGRLELALDAAKRAEAKVYGPRTLRILAVKADILKAMKRPIEEKKELTRAVRVGEGLELSGGYRQLLEQLKARASAP